MMKSDVVIDLDKEDATYNAGDVVEGRIKVTLTQEVNVKSVCVRFSGSGRAGWEERRTYTKGSAPSVSRKNTEVFLDHGIVLLKRGSSTQRERSRRSCGSSSSPPPFLGQLSSQEKEEGVTIPTGLHVYPFKYTLPTTLPSSFDGKWGQIRYGIKVTLERPWKFDIDREIDMVVNGVLDLNEEAEAARPIGGLGDYRPGLVCCGGEPVSTELRLRKRGYVAGDTIPFYAEIENNSCKKLNARVALVQNVTFKADNKLKKVSQTMTSLGRGDIPSGQSEVWDGDSLVIPPTILPSTQTSKLIQIRYRVMLLLSYSSWVDDFTLPVTIIIGTVALRKATLQGHLVNMAHSTPRKSMVVMRHDIDGNPRMPLLGDKHGRQSTPSLQPVDMAVARRRCSAAVVLERPRSRSRLMSESGGSQATMLLDSPLRTRHKTRSSTVIDEEENGEQESQKSKDNDPARREKKGKNTLASPNSISSLTTIEHLSLSSSPE